MGKYTVNLDELPLRDVVFSTLRRQILMGELKPGERLMEVKLTKKMGVSRTPVREAIQLLELEGLVNIVPRKGASVAEITEEDLQDVLEVRCALEELAVELACKRRTEEELALLKEAGTKFVYATMMGTVTDMAERDVEFHNLIFKMTRNERLVQMVGNLSERMYRYRVEYLKNSKMHTELYSEHNEIIRCIEENDPEAGRKAIKRHITNQVETVSRDIKTGKEVRKS